MATIEKYETKSGATLYEVRFRTPDRRSTRRRGFRTKREAEQWAYRIEVAKETGGYVPASAGRTTIGQLGPLWLARQRGHMKPSGFRSYESAWRVHVAPRWAGVPIASVRFSDVQSWVAELAARRGPVIVRFAHSVLARVLDDAVRDRMLVGNPARGIKLPAKVRSRHTYLTATQLDRLAIEAGRYRSLVLLLGVGGVRWSEAAALRVQDVDFLKRRIALHTNAVKVGGTFAVGTLKSGKNRTVAVPGFVTDALALTAAGKSRGELLWPSTSGGYLRPPSSGESWLGGAVARCQAVDPTFPRVTAHDLRHTAVSLAISAGASVLVVSRMVGHSSAAMTLDVYADLFESDLDAVAESVAKLWPRQANSQ